MSDYISKSAVIKLIESKMTDGCLGTEDDTFIGGHGLVDDISDLPTLDEKEIIRKHFERVVERLDALKKVEENRADECDENGFGDGEEIYSDGCSQGRFEAFGQSIQVVKKEGGIE